MSNTKRSFVRGVWGIYDIDHKLGRPYSRRTKIDNDILLAKLNPYSPSFKVYVFGEENFKKIQDMGFDASLIDKKPICWDMVKEQYRHKIEIWKYGLKDFDEIVFLDWDCIPLTPVPKNFWDVLNEGEKIQATLYMYTLQRAFFRPGDARKLSASTFVYIRDRKMVDEIISLWEEMGRPWQEEIVLSKYIDLIDGGWKGIDNYKKYEPGYHCLFWHYSDYSFLRKNPITFFHYNAKSITHILNGRTPEGIKARIDNCYRLEIKNITRVIGVNKNY